MVLPVFIRVAISALFLFTQADADIQMECEIVLNNLTIDIAEPSVIVLGIVNQLLINVTVFHDGANVTTLSSNQTSSVSNFTDIVYTWRLSVWGSDTAETNGTRVSFEGQVLDGDQRNQSLNPGLPLTFRPPVRYKLNLSEASCRHGAEYLCAELVRRPAGLSSGKLRTCIPGPSCKDGVVVYNLKLSLDRSTGIEAGRQNALRINISIAYDRKMTSDIKGTNLWQLLIWSCGSGDECNDTSQRLSLVEQALTQSQADQSLIRVEDFEFVDVEYALDMRNITCVQAKFICVRFRQGSNRKYELLSKPNASVRNKCVPAPNCTERIEIDPEYEISTALPFTTIEVPMMTTSTLYHWLSDVLNDDVTAQTGEEPSPEEIAAELAVRTKEMSDFNEVELTMTGLVIEKMSRLGEVSAEVASHVVDVVDNILHVGSSSMARSPTSAINPPKIIVQSIERLVSRVMLAENGTSNFSASGKNIAIAAFNLASAGRDDFLATDGVLRVYVKEELHWTNASSASRKLVFERVADSGADGFQDADVAVELQTWNLLDSATDPTSNLRIDMIVFRNDSLFSSASSTSGGSHDNPSKSSKGCSVDGKVLSVNIRRNEREIKNLQTPINMTFKIQNANPSYIPTCTYWDFALNDGLGDWSTLGCDLVNQSHDQAVCSCDHLTNFAVLMAPSYGCHPYALDVVSQLGCAVSTLGLILTIITYVMFGRSMGQTPRLIMIQWCVSLLFLYLVFVVGIDRTRTPVVCTAVAALLHYFTLSSVLWMGVEGVNLYILLVRVMDIPRTRRFIPVACLVAWGVPAGFVLLGVCHLGPDKYREDRFCFLSRGPHFIYTLLFPLATVLLVNLVCYILVMRTLSCSRTKIRVTKIEKGKLHDLATRLQQAFAIGLLTGLTWLFGFFAIGRIASVFAWLFCICNSLQGVCVFLLFCVFRPELRRAWKKQICPQFRFRPKRRTGVKGSELDNIRSRSTSLRDTYMRSTSGNGGKIVGSYREYSSNHRPLSG